MKCPKNLTRLCGSFLRSLAKMQRQRNFLFTPWLSMCQSWTQTWVSFPFPSLSLFRSLSAGNFNTYNTRQLKLRARFDKLSKLSAKIWHLTKKKREREKFPEKIEYTRGCDWWGGGGCARKVRAKQRWTVNGRQWVPDKGTLWPGRHIVFTGLPRSCHVSRLFLTAPEAKKKNI